MTPGSALPSNGTSPQNWSSGEPLNGSPSGATYNVFISNGGAVTMSNGLNSSTPIDNLTVGSSSSLAIVDGNNLTITGNTLANAGGIALNSVGHATYLVIGAPSVTLSGGGTITMSGTTPAISSSVRPPPTR